jgi:L-2-hydroxyglutarate oxidase LhgO
MDVSTVVVGAGVVGLAVGRALAVSGRDVVVLEQEAAIGTATSSRNSGVIHAGIYYPVGSLKARLCVRGRALLYDFCATHGVPHRRCGKLIVATCPDEVATLAAYRARAAANDAGDLPWLDTGQVAGREPAVRCLAALLSPDTGIIDVHALLQSYVADIEAARGHVVLRNGLRRALRRGEGFLVELDDTGGSQISCRELVNAGGLTAPTVARCIEGLAPKHVPREYYARGHYFSMSGPPPFSHLIYPVAGLAGLGIHVTVDLGGRVRFGPDVEWIDRIDYSFGKDRSTAIAAAIQRYYPALDPERLRPEFTGIRPKISGPNDASADFRIDGPSRHGVAGLVNLFGIESPGLTASLAIGEHVLGLLDAGDA